MHTLVCNDDEVRQIAQMTPDKALEMALLRLSQ